MTATILFKNARVFDGSSDTLREGCDVLVADGVIQQIADSGLPGGVADVVKCDNRVLMPGLIDAHVHVYAASLASDDLAGRPPTYLAHHATRFLAGCLDRGFTSVRDVAGADVGLADAVADGLIVSPRLFYGGRALSQTGGHGDLRPGNRHLHTDDHCMCACAGTALMIVADGADAVRKAVREELRRGASHIKIMGSGGVVSPTDPLDRCQYSDEEILAAVDEAERGGAYVAAHCHPAAAIRRAVSLGVRSIEHGTMIDAETAAYVAEQEAFVVPTLVTIFAMIDEGARLGLSSDSMAKLRRVADHAFAGLQLMHAAGVRMGFGTDLLGELHGRQSMEFELRARVLPAIEILRSACSVNAELLRQEGQIGCVREGAAADLLLVDGNPLSDISVLGGQGEKLAIIMKGGRFHKR